MRACACEQVDAANFCLKKHFLCKWRALTVTSTLALLFSTEMVRNSRQFFDASCIAVMLVPIMLDHGGWFALLMQLCLCGFGAEAIRCWQCASVDGKMCPESAQLVESASHDSCIVWSLGNGTVLLQNVVRFSNECTATKKDFWTRFINLYYRSTGGEVRCCTSDGCNTGAITEDPLMVGGITAANPSLPGAPLIFGAVSNQPPNMGLAAPTQLPSYAFINPNFAQHLVNHRQQVLPSVPSPNSGLHGPTLPMNNGNCQRYFPKKGNGEWLPNTLMPLSFDRASQTKVGVFYVRFTANNNNNDHVIVRLVGDNRSNSTMYSIKLYSVGSVSIFVSKLKPNNRGTIEQSENRQASMQDAVNLTDTTSYRGFWFTVREDEITVGQIGDQLIDPVLMWNDTKREGPRDVTYFALTTDQSQASFGVNCDVPNLHFEDTCVTDDDCADFPNTVCTHRPVNKGLDPGTRRVPFDDWETRDTLLKSCFCQEGHLRIPESKGCYDPVRQVVTLRDACFADYHCNHLPNTKCTSDRNVPMYNRSCQCIPGNKPFERDPRTGLIEGCAPLTDADRASVLGCGDKMEIDDGLVWVPKELFPLQRDTTLDVDYAVFFIKLPSDGSRQDVAVVRLLDKNRSNRKMLTIKFFRRTGKIAISESTRSRSFFFESERDTERVAVDDLDVMTRMQLDYVGFWVQYRYEDGIGGTISVGLNGAPFASDYSLVRWTDSTQSAIEKMGYYGFTASEGSNVQFAYNCVLVDTPVGSTSPTSFGSVLQQQPAAATPLQAFGTFGAFTGGAAGNNALNGVGPFGQQLTPSGLSPQINSLQAFQNLGFSSQAAAAAVLQAQQQQQAALLQQQQQSLWNAANQMLTPVGRHSGRVGAQESAVAEGAEGLTEEVAAVAEEVEESQDPSELIIEPVLRNQYLTKLKRLLPTFFDDFEAAGRLDPEHREEVETED